MRKNMNAWSLEMIEDLNKKQPYSRAKIILKSCILTFKQAYVIEVKKFILIER